MQSLLMEIKAHRAKVDKLDRMQVCYYCIKKNLDAEVNFLISEKESLFEKMKTISAYDYHVAREGLLMWAEERVLRHIIDESALIDFAIDLDCEWLKDMMKNCTPEEKEKLDKIVSVCKENFETDKLLQTIDQLLQDNMNDEALAFAKKVVEEHPNYQMCWVTLLKCKGITDLETVIATPEYKKIKECLIDKTNNYFYDKIEQRTQELKCDLSKSTDKIDQYQKEANIYVLKNKLKSKKRALNYSICSTIIIVALLLAEFLFNVSDTVFGIVANIIIGLLYLIRLVIAFNYFTEPDKNKNTVKANCYQLLIYVLFFAFLGIISAPIVLEIYISIKINKLKEKVEQYDKNIDMYNINFNNIAKEYNKLIVEIGGEEIPTKRLQTDEKGKNHLLANDSKIEISTDEIYYEELE
ncbi:MAG: hypothetical protein ACI4MI_05340 [Christensenellales bacterium]